MLRFPRPGPRPQRPAADRRARWMRRQEQQGQAGHLWPIHPKPLDDELLSSWMVRIARAYRISPASFWKREVGRIHFRKADLTAEDRLLLLMSARTGTPLERVRATTLLGLRGCGLDWRGGHEDAIRFCPACLEERPYFRRRWRLEFSPSALSTNSLSTTGVRAAAGWFAWNRSRSARNRSQYAITADSIYVVRPPKPQPKRTRYPCSQPGCSGFWMRVHLYSGRKRLELSFGRACR